MAHSTLDYKKETSKCQKKLAEIEKLEKSDHPLNPDQKAKIRKKEEYLKYLHELQVSEHGLFASGLMIGTQQREPLVIEHQQAADGMISRNSTALEQENNEPKRRLKTHEEELKKLKQREGQKATESALEQENNEPKRLLKTHEEELKKLKQREGQKATETALEQENNELKRLLKTHEEELKKIKQREGQATEIALEQENNELKRRLKTHQEELKKLKQREGQKATEMDRLSRRVHELQQRDASYQDMLGTEQLKYRKEMEDVSLRSSKEKADLKLQIEQLNKTLAKQASKTQSQQERFARELKKAEHKSSTLTTMLEEEKKRANDLQQMIGLDVGLIQIQRRKAEASKLLAVMECHDNTIAQQKGKIAELSKLQEQREKEIDGIQAAIDEQEKKLQTSNEIRRREQHETMKRVATEDAKTLINTGHHLNAFLRILEPELICPITYELPEDPVLATDGHTYERTAMQRWFREAQSHDFFSLARAKSPMTGLPLEGTDLRPNHVAKKLIGMLTEWQTAHCPMSDHNATDSLDAARA